MRANPFSNLPVFFFATLILFSLYEPVYYFAGIYFGREYTMPASVFVYVSALLIFYPYTGIRRHGFYKLYTKRLTRSAFVTAIFAALATFIIVSVSNVVAEHNLLGEAVYTRLFISQIWIYLAVITASGMSYIDNRSYFLQPHLIGAILCGLFLTAVHFTFLHVGVDAEHIFKINLIILVICLRPIIEKIILSANYSKVQFLNGPLRNFLVNLYDDVNVVGNQFGDAVNLCGYQEINNSHAKIIRFGNVFSLSNNDPYCRTLLNSSRVSEKILKDMDIITIGSAKLLFLQK